MWQIDWKLLSTGVIPQELDRHSSYSEMRNGNRKFLNFRWTVYCLEKQQRTYKDYTVSLGVRTQFFSINKFYYTKKRSKTNSIPPITRLFLSLFRKCRIFQMHYDLNCLIPEMTIFVIFVLCNDNIKMTWKKWLITDFDDSIANICYFFRLLYC